ncbi:16S rRNA (cytidine(1402)-2'-O)-methyltransferase [Candidatus Acetothermia bacterium]|nr:16S rRNA (cytidine(1402)-2'-O)-methyltransferase [Candidatus Acetothermia bacterium]
MGKATGILYLVATPIGNLEDITLRALRVLKECDFIIAEDTRRSRQLLGHYAINTRFDLSLYQGVEEARVESIVEKLKTGASIALISDAGTPLISDPGFVLVRRAVAENIRVVAIPGPTALVAALVASGFPTDHFVFEGTPPKKPKVRREYFERFRNETRTVIFYESPHRVLDTLELLAELLGGRSMALCRELTKTYEEILRGTPQEILQTLKAREAIKGEITIVLAGARETDQEESAEWSQLSVVEHLEQLIAEGLDKREAIKRVAQLRGLRKQEVYNEALRAQL